MTNPWRIFFVYSRLSRCAGASDIPVDREKHELDLTVLHFPRRFSGQAVLKQRHGEKMPPAISFWICWIPSFCTRKCRCTDRRRRDSAAYVFFLFFPENKASLPEYPFLFFAARSPSIPCTHHPGDCFYIRRIRRIFPNLRTQRGSQGAGPRRGTRIGK